MEVAARWPIRPILGFWESKVHQSGRIFLPWTPMNRRAKFDDAIAISWAEKSVTVQTHTQNYNKKNKQ